MSRLTNLPSPAEVKAKGRIRRGPTGACDIYGDGDLDDWRRVETLRLETSWLQAQHEVDELLGIGDPIDGDKFRYHWRRKCWHWTEDQRRVEL